MVGTLATLAQSIGIPFTYGDLQAQNVAADHVLSFPLLYLEGYYEGSFGIDEYGNFGRTFDVVLWLFSDSQLADDPIVREEQLSPLLSLAQTIYRRLRDTHELTTASFKSGINITDRNLDGLRFAFQATPIIQLPVC